MVISMIMAELMVSMISVSVGMEISMSVAIAMAMLTAYFQPLGPALAPTGMATLSRLLVRTLAPYAHNQ